MPLISSKESRCLVGLLVWWVGWSLFLFFSGLRVGLVWFDLVGWLFGLVGWCLCWFVWLVGIDAFVWFVRSFDLCAIACKTQRFRKVQPYGPVGRPTLQTKTKIYLYIYIYVKTPR